MHIIRAVGATAAILLLLVLADGLGGQLVASQLALEAGHARQLWQQGQPRWQWDLHAPQQLIARHVFGAAHATATSSGLRLTADSDAGYQLGLRLDAPVDLHHWGRMRLDYASGSPLALSMIAAGPGPAACYSPVWTVAAGQRLEQPLEQGPWHDDAGQPCHPGIASILRLVITSMPGRPWWLRKLSLWPSQPPSAEGSPTLDVPGDTQAARAVLAARYLQLPQAAAPVVQLPAALPAGRLLQLRDTARSIWPGAIIVPMAADGRAAGFRLPMAWGILGLYALALLVLLRQPPPPRRGWLDASASLAGLLWLIDGMHFGRGDSWPAAVAALLGLAYAAWLGWRQRSRQLWQWLGDRAGHWLRPLLVLPLAPLLVHRADGSWTWPGLGHALVYLAWACLQQWLMLTVVMPRLQRSLTTTWALPATAGLFMLLHAPNSELMQACLLAELYWAWCFRRDGRLLPVALAHAAAALCLQAGVGPHSWMRSLEVSARFLH